MAPHGAIFFACIFAMSAYALSSRRRPGPIRRGGCCPSKLINGFVSSNDVLWLWVPAFAGTTVVGAALIPIGPESRTKAAHVLSQPRDRLAVLIIEPHLQCIQIGLLALGTRRLGNRGDAFLVEQPFQRDLRGAGIVLAA